MAHSDDEDRGAALRASVASGNGHHRSPAEVGRMPLAAAQPRKAKAVLRLEATVGYRAGCGRACRPAYS